MSRNANAHAQATRATPERALWTAVFEVAVKDLCAKDGSPERRDALLWLGTTRPTRDFSLIAWSLGIDADLAHTRLRALATRPYPERHAYARRAFGAANPIRQAQRSLRRAA